MDELVVGVDVGTASTKGVLVDATGAIVARAEHAHGLSLPRPNWAEHDVDSAWWGGLQHVCHELLADRQVRVAAVSVSGVGPCLLPCDGRLDPLRPAILYGIDGRAAAEIDELAQRYGAEEILARGGSPLTSQAVGPKLLWLQRHEPETWSRTAAWFSTSSYLVAKLTGEYVLDHHTASQCDPLYDMRSLGWAEDWALELAGGVPLPRLVWPDEIVGSVTEESARATGLPPGTPVLAGSVDAWMEAFSVGVRAPGDMMLMYGSTMFIVRVIPALEPRSGLWTTVGVEPGVVTYAAGMSTSGSLTNWLRDLAGFPDFGALAAEAETAPAGATGLLMLPYFAGERSPLFDPDARGAIVGLTLSHSRAELARAVYEATAFAARDNLEVMREAAGDPTRIVAVGGGTRARIWTQIVSSVTGISQDIPATRVGAAFGDALLAAIATGLVPADTDWTQIEQCVTPDREDEEVYAELYPLYRELQQFAVPFGHRLGRVRGASHVRAASRRGERRTVRVPDESAWTSR